MKRQKLVVEKRKIFGKKLKKLRKEGILPANIYGKAVKSQAVQLPYKEFEKVYKEARETGLIDVQLDGELKPSLIHNVQKDNLRNIALHADFFQVNLKEKVKTMVPILTTGIAKAVSDKLGLLLQPLSQIEVEALPTDLPENIEVNVEHLAAVNDQVIVADIKVPKGVTVLTLKDQVVAKIGELVSKEAQAQEAAEKAAAEAAKSATAEAAAPTAEAVKSKEAEVSAQGAAQPKAAEQKPTEAPPLRQGSAGQAKATPQKAAEQKPQEKA